MLERKVRDKQILFSYRIYSNVSRSLKCLFSSFRAAYNYNQGWLTIEQVLRGLFFEAKDSKS